MTNFNALTNNESDRWYHQAEMMQKRGMFIDFSVYELAEMLYNKSKEVNRSDSE